MTQRAVLLDRSFLEALRVPEHPLHDGALARYGQLLDAYEAGADRLLALSTDLRAMPRDVRRGRFAPVESVRVHAQHRRSARWLSPDDADGLALTLVMLRRERIRVVATARDDYDAFALTVLHAGRPDPLPAAADTHAPDAVDDADAAVSSRTGSPLDP